MPQPEPIKGGAARPGLPGRVTLRDDPDRVIDALLADLFIHANNCVRTFGDFHCAISATPEAEPALMRLMFDLPYRDFPWKRTRLWMVDEVDVAADHPERRGTRLAETVVALSGLPETQFHPLDPGHADGEYAKLLREHLGWREKGHDRIDYVLLTVGEDGVLGGWSEGGAGRVCMPRQFIESARLIAVLLAGERADAALGEFAVRARAGELGLAPIGGELVWYAAKEPEPLSQE